MVGEGGRRWWEKVGNGERGCVGGGRGWEKVGEGGRRCKKLCRGWEKVVGRWDKVG